MATEARMKADILTLKALFQKDVRYVIPTFQRPYVWNQEDQWEPLWNDVRNTAEEYLENLVALGEGKEAAAEERTGVHFLGAVVLQQQATGAGELESRHVIDGQQRLTTLQLLLDAAQEVFEQDNFPKEEKQLRKLVLNDEDYVSLPEQRFKVSPTMIDKDAFISAMSNDLPVGDFEESPIVQAHEFFKLQIRQWLADGDAPTKAHGLAAAMMVLLQMVVIDLTTADDANIIFETLNARGTPLLASDLVKNSILHSASESGLNGDALYAQYWQPLDHSWWRTEVAQGRIVRPRLDVFLNYWLTMRTAEEIKTSDVFPRFRRYAIKVGSVTEVVADIKSSGETYRQLEGLSDWSAEGTFLYRWHVMDAGALSPVILWLFLNRATIGESDFRTALSTIESYLVRRMVCRMTTKDYNRLFLDLLKTLSNPTGVAVGRTVLEYFASETSESRMWPSDGRFTEAMVTLPLYQLLTRGRLRLVLEALENSLRSPKAEEPRVPKGLTIEHVMPQAWREHWPLSQTEPGAELDAALRRDRIVHTLGNLTLVNGVLNPALSNLSWRALEEAKSKHGLLSEHSVLQLNKKLLEAAPDVWDESTIDVRSRALAADACRIWPRPI